MRPRRFENALLLIFGVPILGLILGGIYSFPAMRLTRERDPGLTLLLGLGLAITVFGLGSLAHLPLLWLAVVWIISLVLLFIVRAAFGSLGHNLERFGIVHYATLMLLLLVAFIRHWG